ncbi:uncharacterized protein LOC133653243 [Entelurus aequoreus]|uniref:uncharacterized protein LOC133653243 n=1 Tax=Entelurus aequoreus TaxID=161455 RepID=UPI002B1D4356|nr:uncharacterized protein LOC133653243 [Entelurus aequoreus]
MLEANEPSHSTSGSDTITVDRNPLSEHDSITALNLSSDGALVTGSNTVGPPPPYGFTKEGTIGPSPYSGNTAIPSPYGLHVNCQFLYGGHTSSLPPYGLNIKGPSPYEDHASSPSLHDFNTAGPSPNVYNTSGPSPGVHTPLAGKLAGLIHLTKKTQLSWHRTGEMQATHLSRTLSHIDRRQKNHGRHVMDVGRSSKKSCEKSNESK